MKNELSVEQVKEMFSEYGCSCGMRKLEDVVEVFASYENHPEGYSDSDCAIVYKDSKGKFWAVMEWADTTGHGCQCGFDIAEFNTLNDALRFGLDESARDKLEIKLEGE